MRVFELADATLVVAQDVQEHLAILQSVPPRLLEPALHALPERNKLLGHLTEAAVDVVESDTHSMIETFHFLLEPVDLRLDTREAALDTREAALDTGERSSTRVRRPSTLVSRTSTSVRRPSTPVRRSSTRVMRTFIAGSAAMLHPPAPSKPCMARAAADRSSDRGSGRHYRQALSVRSTTSITTSRHACNSSRVGARSYTW